MNLSLGEFQAVAAKALRGAGYSWGMSAEGAGICRALASLGVDASHNLVRLLDVVDELGVLALSPAADWATTSGRTCPIAASAALSDAPPADELALNDVVEPTLLLATLAVVSSKDAGFAITWSGGSVTVGPDGPDHWALPPSASLVISQTQPPLPPSAGRATRIDIDASALERLNAFAHRTYAPSTEASRAAGAGAGLNDND